MLGMETLLTGWVFMLGLVLGSFLNVVIARVPEGLSIVRPGSRCPKCGHAIRWYENIPVLSWIFLRGKCSACKAPISPRYAVVELFTGLLFLACVQRFDFSWALVQALTFVVLVIPLIFIDAEHWILPFELTLPGIALGVLLRIPGGWESVESGLIGAAAGFLSFRAFEFLGFLAFKKEAMGAGDKFLVAMMGAFLGWRVLFVIVFLSSLQGAVFGLIRIGLTGRAGPAPEPDPSESKDVAPEDLKQPGPPAVEPKVGESGVPEAIAAEAKKTAEPAPESKATESDDAEPPEPEPTITWAFNEAGLSAPKRALMVLYSGFLQPIPDEEVDEETGEEVEWEPGVSNLPFGPWLGLSGLEVMLLGQLMSTRLSPVGLGWLFG